MNEVYIERLSAWANGIETPNDWKDWALSKKEILASEKGPDISFTDSLFRRRLSQISKMTIQVIHDILPIKENTKIFFLSFRGELNRQFQINKMLIQEKALSPASFSLSVFNAPAALACMALQLKGGYTAIYPGEDSFSAGLQAAIACLLSGDGEVIFVYADEMPPAPYDGLLKETFAPLAFALLLSNNKENQKSVSLLPFLNENKENSLDKEKPCDFLKRLLLCGDINVSS